MTLILGITIFAILGLIIVVIIVAMAPEYCEHGFLNCWTCGVYNGRKAHSR